MPLFGSSSPPPPPPESRSRGFFGRRSDSPEGNTNGHTNGNGNGPTRSSTRSGGLFSRRRSSSSDSDRSVDLSKDPSIKSARRKVTEAEAAEVAADKALNHARAAVRSAREEVKQLEQDALRE